MSRRDKLAAAGIVLPEGSKVLTTILPEGLAVPKPRNKYNAKPTAYDGVRYSSKGEADRAMFLDLAVATNGFEWWIGQPKFRLGVPENIYVADFLVRERDGVHVEDVKGVETPKFKRDKKLWARYGPEPLWIIKGGKVVEIIPKGTGG